MFQTRGPGEAASGAPAGGTEHAEGRLAATEDIEVLGDARKPLLH